MGQGLPPLSLWKPDVPCLPVGVRPLVTMAEIARRVACEHGLTVADLKGPRRTRNLAHPRQQAMSEMYGEMTEHGHRWSLPQIGLFLGGRDHTTVLHGVRRHALRMAGGCR
jgi:chromosomal replication initiation ATPase DnaA